MLHTFFSNSLKNTNTSPSNLILPIDNYITESVYNELNVIGYVYNIFIPKLNICHGGPSSQIDAIFKMRAFAATR